MFQYTQAIDKIRQLSKPIRIVDGGTFAGKTEGLIADYINRSCLRSDMDTLITAESIPALKTGAIKIFQNIMRETNRWHEDSYNYTDRIYSFSSGSKIQFTSFDSIGKAKVAGKRTHLFVNEAQYIPGLLSMN